MCHDYELEMLRRAYMEELARRSRPKDEARRKPEVAPAPAQPAAPAGVRDKEPVPA